MKKILGIFAIAGMLVACNNDAETATTTNSDTNLIVTPDVSAVVTDTTITRDTIANPDLTPQ